MNNHAIRQDHLPHLSLVTKGNVPSSKLEVSEDQAKSVVDTAILVFAVISLLVIVAQFVQGASSVVGLAPMP